MRYELGSQVEHFEDFAGGLGETTIIVMLCDSFVFGKLFPPSKRQQPFPPTLTTYVQSQALHFGTEYKNSPCYATVKITSSDVLVKASDDDGDDVIVLEVNEDP
jgi:hypothetical protein